MCHSLLLSSFQAFNLYFISFCFLTMAVVFWQLFTKMLFHGILFLWKNHFNLYYFGKLKKK